MKKNKYWFKKTRYVTTPFVPISWEGWVVTLLDFAGILGVGLLLFTNQDKTSALRIAVAVIFVVIDSIIFVKFADSKSPPRQFRI